LVSSLIQSINSQPDIELNEILSILKNYIKFNPLSDFCHFGQILIDKDNDTESFFEVYLRLPNFINSDEHEIEVLLIDVTHSVVHEKNKSEFKYKSIFFSKVAHEFKNPLICMNEIVTQIDNFKETNRISFPEEVQDNLNYLKSMSNFLLVLVKDLDYFSQCQIGKNIQTEVNEVNITELLKFCSEVANCLLKKYNKFGKIQFNIKREADINRSNLYLISDENRLKQILINLISNAIKFTIFGEITLEVKPLENNSLRFSVTDTGSGIKEEKLKNLFLPYQKGQSKNNENGAGLGLSIVNDLAYSLGSEIKFESDTNGSKFWFDLLTSNPEIKDKHIISEETSSLKEELNITQAKCFEPNDLAQNSFDNEAFTQMKSKIEYSFEEEEGRENTHAQMLSNDVKQQQINVMNFNNCHLLITDRSILESCSNLSKINTINTSSRNLNKFFELNDDDIEHFRKDRESLNLIVADDEKFTREAIVRIIKKVAKNEKLKVNVFEAEDGVESIYLTYKFISNGIKISAFFSDETMNYINGSQSSQVIKEIFDNHNLSPAPFFLLTAIQGLDLKSYKLIKGLYPKPVSKSQILEIIRQIKR
jgi:signal transduction histidine kinase